MEDTLPFHNIYAFTFPYNTYFTPQHLRKTTTHYHTYIFMLRHPLAFSYNGRLGRLRDHHRRDYSHGNDSLYDIETTFVVSSIV